MRFAINREDCIGCGLCAGVCPNVFEMDVEGLATVVGQPTAAEAPTAGEALESCPAGAILREE